MNSNKVKKRYQTAPPEGGWGYLIALGLAIPNAAFLGYLSSFGLLYNDFLESIGSESSSAIVLIGCCASALSLAGLFGGILLQTFSIRTVGIIGAIIHTLGSFLTIFAKTVPHLIVSFSILQGLGIGLMFITSYTNFNLYFVERRVFMMSLAQVLKGLFTTAYPFMIQTCLLSYGFRGTLALIAAINSHVFFAMVLMQPVEWHYKKIEISSEECAPLSKIDEIESEESTDIPRRVSKLKSIGIESIEERMARARLKKLERSRSLDYDPTPDEFDRLKRRITSIISINDLGEPAILKKIQKSSKRMGKWERIVDFLDLTLLKDIIYINISLGMTFAVFSDSAFYTLFPMYLLRLGYTKANVATTISISAGFDFLSRVTLAIISYFIQLKARYIFLSGVVMILLFRFILLQTHSFMGILIIVAILGFFRTFFHAPISLIIGDHLPHDRFASGYGLFLFIQGNIIFILGPIVCFIRDYSKSFIIYFYSLSVLLCMCGIPWIIEIICLSIQRKRNVGQPVPN